MPYLPVPIPYFHVVFTLPDQPPFGSPQHVIQYLGAYTHRIAISNNRLISLEGDQLTFHYRDSSHDNRTKEMTLPAFTFIRRFLLHIHPKRFVKIRYYGILCNRRRNPALALCRKHLRLLPPPTPQDQATPSWQELPHQLTGTDPTLCARYGKGHLILKQTLVPNIQRAPPCDYPHSA